MCDTCGCGDPRNEHKGQPAPFPLEMQEALPGMGDPAAANQGAEAAKEFDEGHKSRLAK